MTKISLFPLVNSSSTLSKSARTHETSNYRLDSKFIEMIVSNFFIFDFKSETKLDISKSLA